MKSNGLAFSGMPPSSKERTSSSQPFASMASVLAWIRSYRASRSGESPIFNARQSFNGANQFLLVRRGNFLRGLGIEARQHPVQVPGTMFLRAVSQSFTKLFRALRDVREAF